MAYTDSGSSWENMVGPLLQGAGTVAAVAGDTSTAAGSAEASRFNAGVNDQNALIAESQGRDAVARQQRRAYQVEGAGRAGFAASGVRLDGSALDVLADSASQAELDKQTITYNAHLKVLGFQNSATLDRMKASAAERAGMYKAAADSITGAAGLFKMLGGSAPGTGTPLPTDASDMFATAAGDDALFGASAGAGDALIGGFGGEELAMLAFV